MRVCVRLTEFIRIYSMNKQCMHVNLKYINVSMPLRVWGSIHAHTSVVAYFLIFINYIFLYLLKCFKLFFISGQNMLEAELLFCRWNTPNSF